ncbi:MAG: hypothetical protein JWN86_164 [Planctomycetota bacterium]|nr:hypothetical protein [Planctomycetota bacterium]
MQTLNIKGIEYTNKYVVYEDEVRWGGFSIPWRNMNPGDIEGRPAGSINQASDGQRFAIFPNEQSGRAAISSRLAADTPIKNSPTEFNGYRYYELTLGEAAKVWAPPTENGQKRYQSIIREQGLDLDDSVASLLGDPQKMLRFVEGIVKAEGWYDDPNTDREHPWKQFRRGDPDNPDWVKKLLGESTEEVDDGDSDGDGIPDGQDDDGDGIPDNQDDDDDGDGIPDNQEGNEAGDVYKPPQLTIRGTGVTEGDDNPPHESSVLKFKVTMSKASDQPISFLWYAAPIRTIIPPEKQAEPIADFYPASGYVIIMPGQTETTLRVPDVGDTTEEPYPIEYFQVIITSPTDAIIRHNKARGTILDDDGLNTPQPPPTPPPGPPGNNDSSGSAGSFDPNDKLGPAGVGDASFIQSSGALAYQIRFENEADATAPARLITVTDTLDPHVDLNTFEFTEIEFANHIIAIPSGIDRYDASVPLITSTGANIMVEVHAGLDRITRTISLTLQAFDPLTGWYSEDPLVGLLYPNDDTGRGAGSFSYLVRPNADSHSGADIENRARIVFDFNDPIDTPLVHNTLDGGAPISAIAALPATTTDTTVTLAWSGQDDEGGSGIAGYDIFLSVDGGAWTAILTNTTDTSTTFTVARGHSYAFYSVATDNVGDRQPTPAEAQAQVSVEFLTTTTTLGASENPSTYGDSLSFTAHVTARSAGLPTPAGTVQFLVDGGIFGAAVTLVNGSASSPVISSLIAGDHQITAVYSGDEPFVSSTSVIVTQTVAKAALMISADDKSKRYGAGNPALTASYSGFVNGETPASLTTLPTLTTLSTASSAVGPYAIMVSGASATNYVLTYRAGSINVTPASLLITADDKARPYGSANPPLTATYAGFVNGDTAGSLTSPPTLSTPAVPASQVGTYAILASGAASPNYAISYRTGTLAVTAAPLTITADDRVKLSGQANPTFTASFGGFVLGQDASALGGTLVFDTAALGSSPPGRYAVTPKGLTSADYAITFVAGTLSVFEAIPNIVVSPSVANSTYGQSMTFTATVSPSPAGTIPTGAIQFAIDGANLGAAVSLVGGTASSPPIATLKVGSHAITAAYAGDVAFAPGTSSPIGVNVAKAPLTVTAGDSTKVYGQANPPLTARFDGFVLGQDSTVLGGSLNYITTAAPSHHVGVYPVNPGGLSSDNYAILFVNGKLTITPAPLLIAANDQIQPDGSPLPALTASYSGFVNGDTPASLSSPASLTTTARAGSVAGPYPITVAGASSPDYTITYRPGTLLVQTTPPVTVLSGQLQTIKLGRKKATAIVLTFSGAIDAAAARLILNYRLVSAGRDKKFGTKDDIVTKLKSAGYNPTARTVTLTPKNRLVRGQAQRLTINAAGLIDASGRQLDGNRDGQPGGDYAAALTKRGVTALSVAEAPTVSRGISVTALDTLLGSGIGSLHSATRRRAALGHKLRFMGMNDAK